MKKIIFTVFFFFIVLYSAFAQSEAKTSISFLFTYNNSRLSLADSSYVTNDSNHTEIEALRFYISNICFLKNGKVVLKEKNSFHLVDAALKNSLQININTTETIVFNELSFDLGIDSATNVSGALGGDLDPTKGMYWAWQSGYINFKLEGKSNTCPTRNHSFVFHLGGYHYPFECVKNVSLKTTNTHSINIAFDIHEFLSVIDLTNLNQIMSPRKEAVFLSNQAAKSFRVLQQ